MRQLVKILAASALALTAVQAHGQTFSDIMNDGPDGYVGLAQGVVLIEVDETSVVCQLDSDPAKFANVAKGLPSGMDTAVCVPVADIVGGRDIWPFDGPSLDVFLDGSEGYVHVDEGVVMVEGNSDVALCQIPTDDALFKAYARGGDVSRDGVVCLALNDLEGSAVKLDGWRNFQTFVDQSEGYTLLAPGRVLVESEETVDVRFCEIATSATTFSDYLTKGLTAGVTASCVPTTLFNDRSDKVEGEVFSDALDQSVGYVNLRANLLMVETQAGSQFCDIAMSKDGFAALAADPKAAIAEGDFVATCISSAVFDKTTTSSGGETLRQLIDQSEYYEYIDDNVVLIVLEAGSKICNINLSDAAFDKSGTLEEVENDVTAICISVEEYDT